MKRLLSFARLIKALSKDFLFLYRKKGFRAFPSFYNYIKLHFDRKMMVQEFVNYEQALKKEDFRKTFLTYQESCEYWRVLNPIRHAILARNKFITHVLLEKVGIPMPELYAYYNPEISDSSVDLVRKELESKRVSSCVVKPAVDGAHGSGVFVCKSIIYNSDDCILIKSNEEQVSLKEYCEKNKKTPLLFESKVIQTEQIGRINRSSVNTVRFMTALYPSGESRVIATFMKIGRMGSDIDNAGGGGNVDCAIDVNTGVCYNALQFDSYEHISPLERHPDSHEKINGIQIQDWDSIKSKLCLYQSKLPYIKVIGWDVALTDNGPLIIEINNWWDSTGQLFIGKGWREEVRDCYLAWKDYYKNK